jgi:DNA-binding transcriptional ArsR family regulator
LQYVKDFAVLASMMDKVKIQALNPTLWRTCKMLAGHTRIDLLRALATYPGEGVSSLGRRVNIAEPTASQELRRIQSRGLLQSERQGPWLVYRLAADPQVSSAAPLLKAILTALDQFSPERDADMCVLAAGLAHERRIRMFRHLLGGPGTLGDLAFALRIPSNPFGVHLRTLQAGGWTVRSGNRLTATVPNHPLAKALAKLIQQGLVR